MRDRVSYSARAHRTVIWGSVTQNDAAAAADVRLFARAVAAGVGAEGDGKFAYTMKQSLSLGRGRIGEGLKERNGEGRRSMQNNAMLRASATRLNCSIEVEAIRPRPRPW